VADDNAENEGDKSMTLPDTHTFGPLAQGIEDAQRMYAYLNETAFAAHANPHDVQTCRETALQWFINTGQAPFSKLASRIYRHQRQNGQIHDYYL
jgi:hypothetical protein